jgi:RNA polymerase sigma-70 factor (ECF subfamily)
MYNNRSCKIANLYTVMSDFGSDKIHLSIASASRPRWESGSTLDSLLQERSRFLRFVSSRVEDRQVAEDLLQTAYLKLLTHMTALRDRSRAEAWFFRVLRSLIADHYRQQRRAPARVAVEAMESVPAPTSQVQNSCPCATRELNQLQPSYVDALRRVDIEGCAVEQYAHESCISANNASVRLHRARRVLRLRLEKTCGTCAGAGCFDCTCARGVLDFHRLEPKV